MDTDFQREAAAGTGNPSEIGRGTATWVGTVETTVATGCSNSRDSRDAGQ